MSATAILPRPRCQQALDFAPAFPANLEAFKTSGYAIRDGEAA